MQHSRVKVLDWLENILRFIFIRLLKIKALENNWADFMQFVRFGIVGVSNTIISYLLNIGTIILLKSVGVAWDYVAGNIVAFFLSVLWSFYWNNRFVFTVSDGEKRNWLKALLKTYVSYSFSCIILNNILCWLWITKFGISKMIAPLLNLIISVPINFIINKLWAFKTER